MEKALSQKQGSLLSKLALRVNSTAKTLLKASVSRRYKDKNGEWKSSQSFSRNEIFLAIRCLNKAVERIIEEETAQDGGKVEEEVVVVILAPGRALRASLTSP